VEYVKDVYTCFVDSDNACDLIPREKLWEVLREFGVDGACYWPSGHYIPAQNLCPCKITTV